MKRASSRYACPFCGAEATYIWDIEDIPYFGEVMLTSIQCSSCGFRHSDCMILSSREPQRYELRVSSSDDLNARVIRSSSGTVRIPELGVDIEPGPLAESFVSNVEGILERVENVLRGILNVSKNRRAEELIEEIRMIREGKREITVIVEDPFGNSAIISEKAISRPLTREEISRLKTGYLIFEAQNDSEEA
ncbi:MAG: ZPR1 zinc finger domain-containing protein [Archaeoglobi archaeon]|nr:ZPR1 zinc finger domain-containing protein [Candidatus Mnemosynella bozhongmuii]